MQRRTLSNRAILLHLGCAAKLDARLHEMGYGDWSNVRTQVQEAAFSDVAKALGATIRSKAR